jgi:simple sugar transport system substrate-binding protein
LIFTPSFGYMEPTHCGGERISPTCSSESITGYKTSLNVRHSQCPLLRGPLSWPGIAAGTHEQDRHVAGYVAGFPIPEVVQGINAFTLGMRSVNPHAQRSSSSGSDTWFDPTARARCRDDTC